MEYIPVKIQILLVTTVMVIVVINSSVENIADRLIIAFRRRSDYLSMSGQQS